MAPPVGSLERPASPHGRSRKRYRRDRKVPVPKFEWVGCVAGKQHRDPFAIIISRAEKLLGVVHSDVCGPLEVPSLDEARYFITFIDDSAW